MQKYLKVAHLVEKAYLDSKEDFGQWIWKNHVPLVAKNAEELSQKFEADPDLAVAGAWLHDFGDAFVYRFNEKHELITKSESKKVLLKAGYSEAEISEILEVIIEPHSCRDGNLPKTTEGKVLATADAMAHLGSDFYIQLTWKHIPEGKTYPEFVEWVNEKLDRDFNVKIFFEEVKAKAAGNYRALKTVFAKAE